MQAQRFALGQARFWFTLHEIAMERGDTVLADERLAACEEILEAAS
jgi:hypothetical protein